jgi:hypothetical protein
MPPKGGFRISFLFIAKRGLHGGCLAFPAGVQPYQNLSGNSGIVEFKNQPDFIIVRFDGGDLYVYMSEKVSRRHVEEMKRLAVAGKGLSTYITQHRDVFNGYVRYDPAVHGDLD